MNTFLITLEFVIAGPPFVHPIPELKAVVGREFRVVCPASGYPLDKMTWSKGKRVKILF